MTYEHNPVRVLRTGQVLARLGISRTTLSDWVRRNNFPSPVELGPNSRGWLEHEVEAFLLQRAKRRDRQPVTTDA
jgi:prophage regulatory protein